MALPRSQLVNTTLLSVPSWPCSAAPGGLLAAVTWQVRWPVSWSAAHATLSSWLGGWMEQCRCGRGGGGGGGAGVMGRVCLFFAGRVGNGQPDGPPRAALGCGCGRSCHDGFLPCYVKNVLCLYLHDAFGACHITCYLMYVWPGGQWLLAP
jgi:hypothetical protein